MIEKQNFKYRGARAMTILHAHYMRSVLAVWQQAKATGITLPTTDDSDYDSIEHLISHVFRASRGYMIWMCEKLQLPDPEISPVPELDVIEEKAEEYLEHLLTRWELPLVNIDEDRFGEVYMSNWKIEYSIDAMIEHAVMHPIRHEFQLIELLEK